MNISHIKSKNKSGMILFRDKFTHETANKYNVLNTLTVIYSKILQKYKINLIIQIKRSRNKRYSLFSLKVLLIKISKYLNNLQLDNDDYHNTYSNITKDKVITNTTKHNRFNKNIIFWIFFIIIVVFFIADIQIVKNHLLSENSNEILLLKKEYKVNKCPSEIPALKAYCTEINMKIIELGNQEVTMISVLFSWLFDSIKAINHRLGFWLSIGVFAVIFILIKFIK